MVAGHPCASMKARTAPGSKVKPSKTARSVMTITGCRLPAEASRGGYRSSSSGAVDADELEQRLEHELGEVRDVGVDARERRTDAVGLGARLDHDLADRRREAQHARALALGDGDRRRHRRVAAERHLGDRREEPHRARAVGLARDERGLGVVDLGGDALHRGVVEPAGVEHDARRVAAAAG